MKDSFFVPHNLNAPLAGAQAGPLAGLTALVKDMYDIAGSRTGGGSPDWLAAHEPASQHASAVKKILAAGASITGKTICDEFFYSVSGVNAHYGTPPNIRAPQRIPGGSSSGSAAACGAQACDFALGSDTGGSVRILRRSTACMGCGRRTAGSISPGRWRWRRPLTSPAGSPMVRGFAARRRGAAARERRQRADRTAIDRDGCIRSS